MRRLHPPARVRAPCLELLERRDLPSAFGDAAFSYANDRVAEPRQNFFVYRDADSAFNHGFPSGQFGTISKLDVDVGGIDDPTSPTGVSTYPNRLDRVHGNVLRVTFAPLAGLEFVGLNFEEPKNGGGGGVGRGYNFSTATQLILEARSPTPGGVRVQFGVAGGTATFVQIPQSSTYSTYTFQFSALRLTDGTTPDFSSAHILFTVVTNAANAPGGGTVLIDAAPC